MDWFRHRSEAARRQGHATAPVKGTDWQLIPPIQRLVGAIDLIAPQHRLTEALTSWRTPSFLEPLQHVVDPKGPSGVVTAMPWPSPPIPSGASRNLARALNHALGQNHTPHHEVVATAPRTATRRENTPTEPTGANALVCTTSTRPHLQLTAAGPISRPPVPRPVAIQSEPISPLLAQAVDQGHDQNSPDGPAPRTPRVQPHHPLPVHTAAEDRLGRPGSESDETAKSATADVDVGAAHHPVWRDRRMERLAGPGVGAPDPTELRQTLPRIGAMKETETPARRRAPGLSEPATLYPADRQSGPGESNSPGPNKPPHPGREWLESATPYRTWPKSRSGPPNQPDQHSPRHEAEATPTNVSPTERPTIQRSAPTTAGSHGHAVPDGNASPCAQAASVPATTTPHQAAPVGNDHRQYRLVVGTPLRVPTHVPWSAISEESHRRSPSAGPPTDPVTWTTVQAMAAPAPVTRTRPESTTPLVAVDSGRELGLPPATAFAMSRLALRANTPSQVHTDTGHRTPFPPPGSPQPPPTDRPAPALAQRVPSPWGPREPTHLDSQRQLPGIPPIGALMRARESLQPTSTQPESAEATAPAATNPLSIAPGQTWSHHPRAGRARIEDWPTASPGEVLQNSSPPARGGDSITLTAQRVGGDPVTLPGPNPPFAGDDDSPQHAAPTGQLGPTSPPATAQPTAALESADLEELARRLFEPLTARLKTELRLDRERAGTLTDLDR